ncbi:MAG: hypothetical protein EAZ81_11790 [Verrucomicrobia bacterium]|jgi:hypothetical protein|nr:MAG: hypothetical protein EAZ81_11790 [Verrucomicrobiota bacterium]
MNSFTQELKISHGQNLTVLKYDCVKIKISDDERFHLKMFIKTEKEINVKSYFLKDARYAFTFDENLCVASFGESNDVSLNDDDVLINIIYHATFNFESIQEMLNVLGVILAKHELGIGAVIIQHSLPDNEVVPMIRPLTG